MDYPDGWSIQSRRKQPSLYDEYLSEGRSNGPSSPRSEHNQFSPIAGSSTHNLSNRTIVTDPIKEVTEPWLPAPVAAAPSTSDPNSSTTPVEHGTRPRKASWTRDSPTLPSSASTSSLRRKVPPPPPISIGVALSTRPAVDKSLDMTALDNVKHASTGIYRNFSQPSSPTRSASATTTPISAAFVAPFGDKHGQAKRMDQSLSNTELLPTQIDTSGLNIASPSIPLPQLPSRPTTASLPPLPLSASQPVITSPHTQTRSHLTPSASQPAIAVVNPKVATPRFARPDSSKSDSTTISDPLPTSNTRRVLHLMKTLCGRMSGGLGFRRNPAHAWTHVYCFIEDLEGSLMSELEGSGRTNKYLIVDLRSCRVSCHLDLGTDVPYLQVSIPTTSELIHLKMPSQADLESWYAALLCWQPIERRGMHHRVPRLQPPTLIPRSTDRGRQDSDPAAHKDVPIVRIGRMVYWDSHVSFGNMPPLSATKYSARRMFNQVAKAHGARRWRRVSCTLRENGELKFFTEADNQVIAVYQLSGLTRDAIVRLHPSVMDSNHCIAIYPQYAYPPATAQSTTPTPAYLSLESRNNWEVWFVLLTAFTVPYTYGPSSDAVDQLSQLSPISPNFNSTVPRMFRMSQNLVVKVNDARLPKNLVEGSSVSSGGGQAVVGNTSTKSPTVNSSTDKPCGFYVEIIIDGQLRGRTQLKEETPNPSWRQEYEFTEIPADLSFACILLKYRPPDSYGSQGKQGMPYYHDAYGQLQYPHMTDSDTGFVGVFRDIVIGRVDLSFVDLESRKDSEHWWPVLDDRNIKVTELSLRLRADDHVVMLHEEYDIIGRMLHNFETGLTVQLSLHIPMELKRLSEVLVNIFQATGCIIDWLMSLIEEEVDGVTKDSFLSLSKSRLGQEGRSDAVRDMNKNATLEANLLFRGNTLLTKALDVHMRRIGSEYLASAIGQVVEEICEANIDCEVDPNRVPNANDVQRNWTRLIAITEKVWEAIVISADNCPTELKLIFRHIRACAEDKYGDFLRTIKYSSVSGFLFLRLFCPAVLNPKLFGLLKVEPPPQSRRSFTLIAKSLQTLANMATFGSKEYWMEPMNAFLTSHRVSFKDFIDKVCFMAVEPTVIPEPQPAHSAPNTIRARLPQSSKDGLLSLPYLIDVSKEYANLAELWLHSTNQRRKSTTARPTDDEKAVQLMQSTCRRIRQRAEECVFRAEKASRPGPGLERQWEELVDTLQVSSTLQSDTFKMPFDMVHNSHAETRAKSTPPAQSLDALRISGTDGMEEQADVIGTTPPLKQLDWTTAPDGGAATAEAASMLGGDRSPRATFVLKSPHIAQQSSSPPSPALMAFHPAPTSTVEGLGGSAPSSRPGSSLSMRAASRMARMRAGPSSDSEDANKTRRSGPATGRTASRRHREDKASMKHEAEANTVQPLPLGNSTTVTASSPTRTKATSTARDRREREARESERQRIRDLVNGLTFGRRKTDKAAAAASAAEKAAEKAHASNLGSMNLPAYFATATGSASPSPVTSPLSASHGQGHGSKAQVLGDGASKPKAHD